MDVLVVGAGEMGRWLGRRLAEGTDWEVAFADRDPDAAEIAAADVEGGRTADLDGGEGFDLVCVAVPISATEAAIAEHVPRAERAILDVSGVMTGPVRAMAEHAPDRERASLHPLFAPSSEPGNVAVVAGSDGPVLETVRKVLADRGNDLFETTPEEHDEAMRTVQARAHTAVLAYALAAEDVDDRFHTPVSADLEAVAERVTGNEPSVYAEIQGTFEGAGDVADAARRVADADTGAFERLYRDATEGTGGDGP
ncbi:prephenate dehydrogenase [Halobacteriales archaeon QS_5_70_15]|nr:MAG: prephenate dehydrogenase [Halobacteriales archaeon QS_5_70_15]